MIKQCKTVANPKQHPRFSLKGITVLAEKGTAHLYDPDTLTIAFKMADD